MPPGKFSFSRNKSLLLATGLLFCQSAYSVTCSCASVPLLGSMESTTPNKGSWLVSYNFELRDLSEAVSGSEIINDGTDRTRITESTIIEISRGLTPKWTLSSLFSYVNHQREIGGGDRQTATGPGNAIIMAKYSPQQISIFSRNALTFGFGSRLPAGQDSIRKNQILLAEDMQPSNGAWAGIGWVHFAHAFSQQASLQVYSTFSYTHNFENEREYQFGHEANLELGSSYQLDSPFGIIAGLHYRKAKRDQRNQVEIPNTGGEWVDFKPAIQYHFNAELAGKLGATIPIWRKLNDTIQFTTREAVTVSLSYLF